MLLSETVLGRLLEAVIQYFFGVQNRFCYIIVLYFFVNCYYLLIFVITHHK